MFAMVRFLVRDVVRPCISRGGTDGERSVAFLPAKVSVEILLDPVGRVLLEISHDISNAMHWTETRQDVHVIVHTANNLRNPVHSPDYAAQVRMKCRSPFGTDKMPSVLCRENDMVMQTEKS